MPRVAGSGKKRRERTPFENELERNLKEQKTLAGKPYSEQSIKNYLAVIYKLGSNFLGKEELMANLTWLEDPKKIITFINTTNNSNGYPYSNQSKLSMYQAIMVSLKAMGITEEAILKPYWTTRDDLNIKNTHAYATGASTGTSMSANQDVVLKSDNNITKDDLNTLVEQLNGEALKDDGSLATKTYNSPNQALPTSRKLFMIATIIKIHTEFPFRNDVADVKVVLPKTYAKLVKEGEDKEFNWLIIGKPYRFIINKYKMAHKYGPIIAEVEDASVKTQLKKWMAVGMDGIVDNKYLFSWEDGRPLTRNNVSVLLSVETKKRIGVSISTTLLAKITDDTPNAPRPMTDAELARVKKQSELRGHSPAIRFHVYRNPKN